MVFPSASFILRTITKCKRPQALKLSYFNQFSVYSTKNPQEIPLPSDEKVEEEIILDIYKERLKYAPLLLEDEEDEEESKFGNLNLNRGLTGVFDIEDLVETLKHQQAEDIFVSSVPKEIKYVDYIVVVSGRSARHMQAIAQFVRKLYKAKRQNTDVVPKLEGKNSHDWMALDLNNIALHIFSRRARPIYDLDSLWAVGPQHDEEYNKKDFVASALESYTFSLKDLEPAE